MILAVGPEGGFTLAETRSRPPGADGPSSALSVNTLRIETAALAGCAILFMRMQESNE